MWGSQSYAYVNPDYPLALPALEALELRVAGIGYGSAPLSLLDIGRFHWSDTVPASLRAAGMVAVAVSLALLSRHVPEVRPNGCGKQVQNALSLVRNEGVEEYQMLDLSDMPLGKAAQNHAGITMTDEDDWFCYAG